jgi:mRNA interferase MazF
MVMQRGDVYELRLPRGVGHEQHGRRLGVVVQSDATLPRSVVLIAPTSTSARAASFRPIVEIADRRTRVLVEQVGAVDLGRLGDPVGRVTVEEQWQIDAALLTVLGLD